jgi:hypothetical protein
MFHGDCWLDRQPRSGNIPGVAGASSTQLMLTGWRWFVHEVFTKKNALLDSLICWLICLLVGCWLIQMGNRTYFICFTLKSWFVYWCSHNLYERSKMDIHGYPKGIFWCISDQESCPFCCRRPFNPKWSTAEMYRFWTRQWQILYAKKCFIPNPNVNYVNRHHCHRWYFTFVSHYCLILRKCNDRKISKVTSWCQGIISIPGVCQM